MNSSHALFGWKTEFDKRCLPCSLSLPLNFENAPLCASVQAQYFSVHCHLEIQYSKVNMKLKCSQNLMERFFLAAVQENMQNRLTKEGFMASFRSIKQGCPFFF